MGRERPQTDLATPVRTDVGKSELVAGFEVEPPGALAGKVNGRNPDFDDGVSAIERALVDEGADGGLAQIAQVYGLLGREVADPVPDLDVVVINRGGEAGEEEGLDDEAGADGVRLFRDQVLVARG